MSIRDSGLQFFLLFSPGLGLRIMFVCLFVGLFWERREAQSAAAKVSLGGNQ